MSAQVFATNVLAAAVSPSGHRDIWWLIILKTVVIFAFLMVMTLFMIWAERRVVARMQQRLGPNRVGPFGLLQGLADGIKLALKEDLVRGPVDQVGLALRASVWRQESATAVTRNLDHSVVALPTVP